MRRSVLTAAALAVAVVWGAGTAHAGKVEIKGTHICCGMCEKAITGVLSKVDGVSDAAADKGKGTVTFTTKDDKTTAAAISALNDAGFTGTAADDGKEVKTDLPSPKKGEKADEITVSSTHVCCMQCKKAITALFPDATVDFPDKGTVKISGKGLDKAATLESLRKAGFNGKLDK
jgi:copper chaperone CopZ